MRPILVALALLGSAPLARAQGTIEDEVGRIVPDLFAGLLGVTLSEELSGSTLRIDNGAGAEDTRLSTFRLPWEESFAIEGLRGALHLEATAGLLLAQDALQLDTPSGLATVKQDWTIVGAQLGAGWGFPVGAGWSLRPGATLAFAYLENEARYNDVAEVELAPLIEGTLVNWDGWAVSPALNLTLERERDPRRLAFGFESRYSLASTSVFGATSEAQEGHDTSRILAARLELGAPLATFPDGSLRSTWDVFVGGIQLGDVEPEALGFDQLLELGAGLSRDFARLPPLRFGVGWLVGEDVRGYSLGLSLGF